MGLCYRCGDGIETGKCFIPIDPKGTKGRRWVCTDCATKTEKDEAREKNKNTLEFARLFDPDFLREEEE